MTPGSLSVGGLWPRARSPIESGFRLLKGQAIRLTNITMPDIINGELVEVAYNKFKGKLTPRERDVITRYYGIGKQVRHSLNEIAKSYKVTRERIRQIKAESLQKIKIK